MNHRVNRILTSKQGQYDTHDEGGGGHESSTSLLIQVRRECGFFESGRNVVVPKKNASFTLENQKKKKRLSFRASRVEVGAA